MKKELGKFPNPTLQQKIIKNEIKVQGGLSSKQKIILQIEDNPYSQLMVVRAAFSIFFQSKKNIDEFHFTLSDLFEMSASLSNKRNFSKNLDLAIKKGKEGLQEIIPDLIQVAENVKEPDTSISHKKIILDADNISFSVGFSFDDSSIGSLTLTEKNIIWKSEDESNAGTSILDDILAHVIVKEEVSFDSGKFKIPIEQIEDIESFENVSTKRKTSYETHETEFRSTYNPLKIRYWLPKKHITQRPVHTKSEIQRTGIKVTLKNGEKYLFFETTEKGENIPQFNPNKWVGKIQSLM